MKIIFIIDFWGAYNEEITTVNQHRPSQIIELRKKIRNFLGQKSTNIVKFRFNDKTIYEKFNDLEGLDGIEVKHIIPKVQLANIIRDAVPDWLTSQNIVELGLLNSPELSENDIVSDDIKTKILFLANPDLLFFSTFDEFYEIIVKTSEVFIKILEIDELYLFILSKLRKIQNTESVDLLLQELNNSQSPSVTIKEIAREQVLEKARKFVQSHNITSISFPPRKFNSVLLNDIPAIQLIEDNAGIVLAILIELLERVDLFVRDKLIDPHHLAEIVVPWPSFIKRLNELLQENNKLATTALETSLDRFDESHIIKLKEKVHELLKIGSCEPLPESSNINDALVWGREYLTYAQHCFLHNKEPDDHVSDSFTKWFLDKRVTIQRSDFNWNIISDSIEENLKADRLVVFCIVDALGGIHLDLLNKELESLEGIDIDDKLVFAPVPTLTEIGKMSVVTGIVHSTLPKGDQKSIIWKRYGKFLNSEDELQVKQSWKEFRNPLNSQTRMFICFENRIDERLHGCIDYKKHKKDVNLIVKSLVKDIQDWLGQAAQLKKEIEIIISADHGVSCISKVRSCDIEGVSSLSERVCRMKVAPASQLEFTTFLLDNDTSKKGYLTPTNRTRFTGQTQIVHGGLTAEEVLIPFVVIKKGIKRPPQKPLELIVEEEDCQVVDKGWQVQLSLITHDIKVEKVFILTSDPFSGREGPIGPLYPHKKTPIRFLLSSNVEQYGLLDVPFIVDYQQEGQATNNKFELALKLRLPPTLLEKDSGTQSFDDMFD